MNFIEFESKQKLRGGFYTEPSIARFLVKWIKNVSPKSILEPSCGDGAFLDAIEKERISALRELLAFELDPREARKARSRTNLKPKIFNTDFLNWYLLKAQHRGCFDAVVGNPPFIRYQYLPTAQQLLAEQIFLQLQLPFTKHTNAWVPFVIASIKLLRPGGRLAMVIPSEILHITHAQSLRRYLAMQCTQVLIIDPSEIWFSDTLQGTVLLLAEKKRHTFERSKGVGVVPVADRKILSTNPEQHFRNATYINDSTIEGKWMPLLLTARERALLTQMRARRDVKMFSDIAEVDVGIVTGANSFFLVPDATVEEFALKRWAHPMFGRSNHVKGLVYSRSEHQANGKTGLPVNFLWFQEERYEDLPSNVRRYLSIGMNQKLHMRFKCRMRKPWYKVPSVHSTPIAMMKRAHHYPRLVLNRANVYTTDTAYRIRPFGSTPEALVFSFSNSLTGLTAEMEGRHYGGGVLELVPSEIERLLIPIIKANREELNSADQMFRSIKNESAFLQRQDSLIFRRMHLARREQHMLHNAWLKLRNRRHRVPSHEDLRAGGANS